METSSTSQGLTSKKHERHPSFESGVMSEESHHLTQFVEAKSIHNHNNLKKAKHSLDFSPSKHKNSFQTGKSNQTWFPPAAKQDSKTSNSDIDVLKHNNKSTQSDHGPHISSPESCSKIFQNSPGRVDTNLSAINVTVVTKPRLKSAPNSSMNNFENSCRGREVSSTIDTDSTYVMDELSDSWQSKKVAATNSQACNRLQAAPFDPVASLAAMRREFGEHGGVNVSVEQSTTFTVMEPETMEKMFDGRLGKDRGFFVYSRHFNPTVVALGRQLASIEGSEAAYCTASGMAAIASSLLQLCNNGDHIVASNRLYGGTHAFLKEFLPRISGICTNFVDITDLEAVEAAIVESNQTKVLYFESVSNPTLTVADIPSLSSIAKKYGVAVVVDNTFMPMIISPIQHGADVVIHSVSKFISGASDIVAGCVCGSSTFINSMMDLHQGALMLLGGTMSPTAASSISSRIPHLGLRMMEHSKRASLFAERLQKLGLKVLYPGLESHPQHAILLRLVNPGYGFGGIFCVDLGTRVRANDFVRYLQNGCQFGLMAVSLGFSETLMSVSGSSTSSELDHEDKVAAGLNEGLVRISLGYSGQIEQRWDQLVEAVIALKLGNPLEPKACL